MLHLVLYYYSGNNVQLYKQFVYYEYPYNKSIQVGMFLGIYQIKKRAGFGSIFQIFFRFNEGGFGPIFQSFYFNHGKGYVLRENNNLNKTYLKQSPKKPTYNELNTLFTMWRQYYVDRVFQSWGNTLLYTLVQIRSFRGSGEDVYTDQLELTIYQQLFTQFLVFLPQFNLTTIVRCEYAYIYLAFVCLHVCMYSGAGGNVGELHNKILVLIAFKAVLCASHIYGIMTMQIQS
eukprot:TRINITY_DN4602_c0_g1_i1.p4 TRINITY_DN4602_c0_g1~~TRINITY_DN4602_c0_g1_i1.p4  ORF type:complete len:232 (+),score=-11.83 TRINITY_DN4602_c0_g1_i1:1685-2380(+)